MPVCSLVRRSAETWMSRPSITGVVALLKALKRMSASLPMAMRSMSIGAICTSTISSSLAGTMSSSGAP
ncbi:hypothetical protein D3C85_1701920 [compost metagenome]